MYTTGRRAPQLLTAPHLVIGICSLKRMMGKRVAEENLRASLFPSLLILSVMNLQKRRCDCLSDYPVPPLCASLTPFPRVLAQRAIFLFNVRFTFPQLQVHSRTRLKIILRRKVHQVHAVARLLRAPGRCISTVRTHRNRLLCCVDSVRRSAASGTVVSTGGRVRNAMSCPL